jgi:hypothetical protein
MIEISFLAPYPEFKGQRRYQSFHTVEDAVRMITFYNSLGAYDARIESPKLSSR